jgi:hypothetical protein
MTSKLANMPFQHGTRSSATQKIAGASTASTNEITRVEKPEASGTDYLHSALQAEGKPTGTSSNTSTITDKHCKNSPSIPSTASDKKKQMVTINGVEYEYLSREYREKIAMDGIDMDGYALAGGNVCVVPQVPQSEQQTLSVREGKMVEEIIPDGLPEGKIPGEKMAEEELYEWRFVEMTVEEKAAFDREVAIHYPSGLSIDFGDIFCRIGYSLGVLHRV